MKKSGNSLLEAAEQESATSPIRDRDRKIARLESKLREVNSIYKETVQDLERQRDLNEFCRDVKQDREWERWERDLKQGRSKATAIVLASDWHVGEQVKPNTVNGVNFYNQAEASRRIKRFFKKIPEYIDRYVPMAKDLVLWAGGDFITNYLHEDQKKNNTMAPTEETIFFRDHWNSGIDLLLREFKGRIIIPTSVGNHGRTTQKVEDSVEAVNSYEWMIYKILEQDRRGDPRVKYRITESYHNPLWIHGRMVRFGHGHACKGGTGVGGVHIPLRKLIGIWNSSDRADLDCLGHFHSYFNGGNYVINCSLMGTTAYSKKRFGVEPPSQTFLVYDGKFGVRTAARIFVTDH